MTRRIFLPFGAALLAALLLFPAASRAGIATVVDANLIELARDAAATEALNASQDATQTAASEALGASPEPSAVETLANASAAVLIDADTGRVLFAQHAEAPLPMASTTKVMTALLALEHGRLDELVTTGVNAYGVPGTSIYLEQGERRTLRELLYGLMLASGNDAAVAIAEHIGGTTEAFCARMTERAAQLGCTNTAFLTPHGLPKDGHYTTARDLALIAREAMTHALFREIVSTQHATIPWEGHAYDRVLTNKNRLLSGFAGATGIKTGYTKAAGRCLVFSAQRGETELIGVVLNCPDWFDESAAILNRGFERFEHQTWLRTGEAIRRIPVTDGDADFVTVVCEDALGAALEKGANVYLSLSLPDALAAQVRKGDTLGRAELVENGKVVAEARLVAAETVRERTFSVRLESILREWLGVIR